MLDHESTKNRELEADAAEDQLARRAQGGPTPQGHGGQRRAQKPATERFAALALVLLCGVLVTVTLAWTGFLIWLVGRLLGWLFG